MHIKDSESGQSLAMVAAFLLFVGLPLLALIIDGTRLYRARSLLQVATDAACQAGAVSGPDFESYKQSGKTVIAADMKKVKTNVIQTFSGTFSPGGSRALQIKAAHINIHPDYANNRLRCTSDAYVPLIMLPRTVMVTTSSTSTIRFSSE